MTTRAAGLALALLMGACTVGPNGEGAPAAELNGGIASLRSARE